ncbi:MULTISPECIES: heme acquisition protein HasA [Cupriavidus]
MTITIQLNNSGVNLTDYNGFNSSDPAEHFAPAGRGAFAGPTPSGGTPGLSGSQYLATEAAAPASATGAEKTAIAGGELVYDFFTHTLAGSLDTVELGTGGLTAGGTGEYDFNSTPAISISGLGLTGSGAGNVVHNVAYGLMNGNFGALDAVLDANNLVINGGSGNDTIAGHAGNDVLTGNGGADAFVFGGGFGHDTVADFSHAQGDQIVFSSSLFGSFGAVQAAAVQSGADTVITYDASHSVTLTGVSLAGLQAGDFAFV